jgi:glucokinase
LRRIAGAAKAAVTAASKVGVRLVAMGAADPGLVDIASGDSVRAVNVPGWQNIPVGQKLHQATDLPVVIQRGDGLQALGEVAFGAGRGVQNAIYVTLVEGIGGGIVEKGQLLVGRDGSAGEIGHMRISEGGPPCGCGGRGCLEAYLAPARLAALWRGVPPELAQQEPLRGEAFNDDFTQMLQAAREGDPRARKILTDAAGVLARGIGNAVNLLNPQRIILGGRFVQAGDLLLEPLRQALANCAIGELLRGVEVRLAELGEASAFLGMAAYVGKQLFAYPSVTARFERIEGRAPFTLQKDKES